MAHYYDINATFNTFSHCQAAVDYLTDVIEEQSPDRFHWSVFQEALDLCITGRTYTRRDSEPDYNEEAGWLGHCDQSTLC